MTAISNQATPLGKALGVIHIFPIQKFPFEKYFHALIKDQLHGRFSFARCLCHEVILDLKRLVNTVKQIQASEDVSRNDIYWTIIKPSISFDNDYSYLLNHAGRIGLNIVINSPIHPVWLLAHHEELQSSLVSDEINMNVRRYLPRNTPDKKIEDDDFSTFVPLVRDACNNAKNYRAKQTQLIQCTGYDSCGKLVSLNEINTAIYTNMDCLIHAIFSLAGEKICLPTDKIFTHGE